MEEDNQLGQVIKGPWETNPRAKEVEEIQAELARNLAEDLTQELIVHMIQMCHNNKIAVDNEKFIQDIGIVIEFTRGLVYRALQMEYPTQDIVDTFVNVSTSEDGEKHTEVDIYNFSKYVELFQSDDEGDEE